MVKLDELSLFITSSKKRNICYSTQQKKRIKLTPVLMNLKISGINYRKVLRFSIDLVGLPKLFNLSVGSLSDNGLLVGLPLTPLFDSLSFWVLRNSEPEPLNPSSGTEIYLYFSDKNVCIRHQVTGLSRSLWSFCKRIEVTIRNGHLVKDSFCMNTRGAILSVSLNDVSRERR